MQPYLMPIMIMVVVRSFLGEGGKKEEGGDKAEAAKKTIKAAK